MGMAADPDAARREPRGLGGWLILLALNIVLLIAAYGYLASLDIRLLSFHLAHANTLGEVFRAVLTYAPDMLVGVVLPVWVLVLFAMQHRRFPAACIVFFASLIVLALYDYVLFAIANWEALSRNPHFIPPRFQTVAIGFAIDIALLAIWGTYLKWSARVANTFVR